MAHSTCELVSNHHAILIHIVAVSISEPYTRTYRYPNSASKPSALRAGLAKLTGLT